MAISFKLPLIGKNDSNFSRMCSFRMKGPGVLQVTCKLEHEFKIPHHIIGQVYGGNIDVQLGFPVDFHDIVK